VAQGIGPEFKPQYRTKKQTKPSVNDQLQFPLVNNLTTEQNSKTTVCSNWRKAAQDCYPCEKGMNCESLLVFLGFFPTLVWLEMGKSKKILGTSLS
jgi:hypothetical protein